MRSVDAEMVVQQLIDVLREALEGPREQRWSYFTDNNPEAGFLGTLRALSAEQASQVIGTASVASHVYHTIFGMEVSAAWITGNRVAHDWSQSWKVTEVTEAEWQEMIGRLENQYHTLSQSIGAFALTDEIAAGVSAGGLAHVAYHLGAVQQKLELILATT